MVNMLAYEDLPRGWIVGYYLWLFVEGLDDIFCPRYRFVNTFKSL